MTSDTLRQKFIYDVPFDDDGFPLLKLDHIENKLKMHTVLASDLWFIETNTFNALCTMVKKSYAGVSIKIDHTFRSSNPILLRGYKCYLMSFAYLFKKEGLKCQIM